MDPVCPAAYAEIHAAARTSCDSPQAWIFDQPQDSDLHRLAREESFSSARYLYSFSSRQAEPPDPIHAGSAGRVSARPSEKTYRRLAFKIREPTATRPFIWCKSFASIPGVSGMAHGSPVARAAASPAPLAS